MTSLDTLFDTSTIIETLTGPIYRKTRVSFPLGQTYYIRVGMYNDQVFIDHVGTDTQSHCQLKTRSIKAVRRSLTKLFNKTRECTYCEGVYNRRTSIVSDQCDQCTVASFKRVPDDNCSICLSPLKDEPCARTECDHFFHRRCFYKLPSVICICDAPDMAQMLPDHCVCYSKKCPLCRDIVENKWVCDDLDVK